MKKGIRMFLKYYARVLLRSLTQHYIIFVLEAISMKIKQMFINWSILISILYKLHYVNCNGDKKIHNNQEKQHRVFLQAHKKSIKIFSQNDFFLKETCFQCQETEFMKTKWKEGNSHNIPAGRSTLEFTLLWDHQTPKNPCSRKKKYFWPWQWPLQH